MARILRLILFPFSFLYGLILEIRNLLFDLSWLPVYEPKVTTIAIGNLSMGGTGKTPFTELLIRHLQRNYKIAVVSRGYGRKTKGFYWVNNNSNASEMGDEPLQIKRKFPSVLVAVCEKRAVAIKKIEIEHPEIKLILLDDAFQHRHVSAQINILLTAFARPFWKDFIVPAGYLREWRKGFRRADITVVTKCPDHLSSFDRNSIQKIINPPAYQKVFFAKEKYGKMYELFTGEKVEPRSEACLLVSGIANDGPLLAYVSKLFERVEAFRLNDHVEYDKGLVEKIAERYKEVDERFLTSIVVTEKDAVKLKNFKEELNGLPVLVLPFEHDIWDADLFFSCLEEKIMS